jgi:hypothetical protein
MPVLHSFIPYLSRSKQLVPRSMFLNPMLANLQVTTGGLVLSIRQRLHKPAPPTQPGNDRRHYRIQSLIPSEPCLHASGPAGQLLQARAVQSNIVVFYQRHVCTVPAGPTSIGIADVGTSPVGQPLPRSVPSQSNLLHLTVLA